MPGIGHNSINFSTLGSDARKQIKKAILEMNDSLTRIAAERDLQKEILTKLEEDLGVEKKKVRKLAKSYYNGDFRMVKEENQQFEEAYQLIIDGSTETVVNDE